MFGLLSSIEYGQLYTYAWGGQLYLRSLFLFETPRD